MEDLIKSKQFKVLFIIFIVISVFHILYATYTCRGMYMDGAAFMTGMLNNVERGINYFCIDSARSRFSIQFIQEGMVYIAYWLLFIKNKFALMGIYTFSQIAFPFLILIWNYFLSKRTGKIIVFYWSLFAYGTLVLPCLIYSQVETHIGIMLLFIIWNYLIADIEFKKRDIVFIFILMAAICGTYEYVSYLGVIFFTAYFHYIKESDSFLTRFGKHIIGFGSLYAAIFNIIHLVGVESGYNEIPRFIGEFKNVLPQLLHLNYLLVVFAIILSIIFFFRKKELNRRNVDIFLVFMFVFIYLIGNKYSTIHPMWEGHFRTIPCVALPLIFIWMIISDKILKKYNSIRVQNFICIIIMLCLFQTFWQIIETSFWYKNIMYMKEELAKAKEPLYIPSEHEELISDFHEPNIRRYIWHWVFINTSILFADEYKPKTILMNYDEPIDPGNATYREYVYVPNYRQDLLNVPADIFIHQKNRFWDLTDIAKAIDKYNKEHNIKTDG